AAREGPSAALLDVVRHAARGRDRPARAPDHRAPRRALGRGPGRDRTRRRARYVVRVRRRCARRNGPVPRGRPADAARGDRAPAASSRPDAREVGPEPDPACPVARGDVARRRARRAHRAHRPRRALLVSRRRRRPRALRRVAPGARAAARRMTFRARAALLGTFVVLLVVGTFFEEDSRPLSATTFGTVPGGYGALYDLLTELALAAGRS